MFLEFLEELRQTGFPTKPDIKIHRLCYLFIQIMVYFDKH